MPEQIFYTNDMMRADLNSIIRELTLDSRIPDVVVGLARGGLIPAAMLSHYFDVPMISLRLSLRDFPTTDSVKEICDALKQGKRVLVVDDICDAGTTLSTLYELVEAVCPEEVQTFLNTAVLFNNVGQDVYLPCISTREINKAEEDLWIVFPWEDWWRG